MHHYIIIDGLLSRKGLNWDARPVMGIRRDTAASMSSVVRSCGVWSLNFPRRKSRRRKSAITRSPSPPGSGQRTRVRSRRWLLGRRASAWRRRQGCSNLGCVLPETMCTVRCFDCPTIRMDRLASFWPAVPSVVFGVEIAFYNRNGHKVCLTERHCQPSQNLYCSLYILGQNCIF